MSFDYSEMQRLEGQKRKYKTFEEILMQTIYEIRSAYVDPHHLYIHKDLAWPLFYKHQRYMHGPPRYQMVMDRPWTPFDPADLRATVSYSKYPMMFTIFGMEAKLSWESPIEQVVLMNKDGRPLKTIVLPEEVVAEIKGYDKTNR